VKKVPTTSGRKTTQLTQLEIITITNTYKSSRMHYTYMSEVTSGGRHERTPYTTVSIWRNGLYSLWMERISSTLSLAAILLKSGPLFATLSSLASFREDEEEGSFLLKEIPMSCLEPVTPKSMILGHWLTAFIQMPLMRKTLSWTTFLLVMPFFPCLALLSFLLFPPTLALALSLPML